jgi:hypothetical protein
MTFVIFAGHFYLQAQDKDGFRGGYDAVQAAPKSHRVIFGNAFVGVLEVTMPPGDGRSFAGFRACSSGLKFKFDASKVATSQWDT